MILDGVLADRSVTWLGSEREKRRYFNQRLGDSLRDDEYPRLVFGKRPNVTVRYFPDKLPIPAADDPTCHLCDARAAAAPGVIRIRRRVLIRAAELLEWLDQKRAPSLKE
jgi:hypothetical protein